MDLARLPLVYRLVFLWIEPFFAFSGAMLCIFNAPTFLNTFSGNAVYAPDNQVIYDMLAATYILFAFNQAVALRVHKDLQVWKTIVRGILLCDAVHLFGVWRVMGTATFLNPTAWRPEDWINFSASYVPIVVRITFLLDVGLGKEGSKKV